MSDEPHVACVTCRGPGRSQGSYDWLPCQPLIRAPDNLESVYSALPWW